MQKKDPVSASKIHINDHYRLVRALEVIRREGRPLSEIKSQFDLQNETYPRPYLKLGVRWEKSQLERRIQQRTKKMLSLGLVEEVKNLLDQGLESWGPMQSVGYKETVQMIQEKRSAEWLFSEIVRSTLQLAKKQRTWFQRDKQIKWFEGSTDELFFREEVRNFLNRTSP